MDKKNKIFFAVFFLLIFGSVGVSFWKYFVARDYYIKAQTECNPEMETCFVLEDEESEEVSYYKYITKKAYDVPDCNPNDESCPPLICRSGEDCEETLCSEETIDEGTECNDPEKYLEEMAASEEAEEESLEEESSEEEEAEPSSEEEKTVENESSEGTGIIDDEKKL